MSKTKNDALKMKMRTWLPMPSEDLVATKVTRVNSKGKIVAVKFRQGLKGLKIRYGEKGDRCKVVVTYAYHAPQLNSNTIQAWPLAVIPASIDRSLAGPNLGS